MDTFINNKAGQKIDPASDEKLRDIEDSLNLQKAFIENLELALAMSPEEDSGQQLTNASKDTDTLVAVTPGIYALTASTTGGFYAGIADVTTTKNIRWVCPLYETAIIKVPDGNFELHYATDTNSAIGYLRKLS